MPRIALSPLEAQVVKLAEARRADGVQVAAQRFAAEVSVVLHGRGVTGGASFDGDPDGTVYLVTPDITPDVEAPA